MSNLRWKSNLPMNYKKRILIITDGLKTETGYFEHLKSIVKDWVIEVKPKGGKKTRDLIDTAIRMRNKSNNYDVVSVVCDIDDKLDTDVSKTTLELDVQYAKDNNIVLCLSNESFEIWLLAHKTRIRRDIGNRKVAHKEACSQNMVTGNNGKIVVKSKITEDSIKKAIVESERLRTVYGRNILDGKPLTDVDKIVCKMMK